MGTLGPCRIGMGSVADSLETYPTFTQIVIPNIVVSKDLCVKEYVYACEKGKVKVHPWV